MKKAISNFNKSSPWQNRWQEREWLDYGALRGIGQWRNSGKGRYTYEILN